MHCPACVGLAFHLVRSDAPLYRCRTCHHCWQHPADITAKYDADYVAERYDTYTTNDAMSRLRLGMLEDAALPLPARPLVLDVGYGNGAFLKTAAAKGYEAYGYDVHGQSSKYGVTEVAEDWVCPSPRGWDVVTFFDSLEHIASLDRVVEKLRGKTKAIMVSWPMTPGIFPEFTLDWKHYRPGEHLHYFSPGSMLRFGSRVLGDKCEQTIWDTEDRIRGRLRGGGWNIATSVLAPDQ